MSALGSNGQPQLGQGYEGFGRPKLRLSDRTPSPQPGLSRVGWAPRGRCGGWLGSATQRLAEGGVVFELGEALDPTVATLGRETYPLCDSRSNVCDFEPSGDYDSPPKFLAARQQGTLSMRRSLVLHAIAMTCLFGTARADDCGIFDIKCIGQKAGRDAAIEVVKGLDTATLNAREMTNQFGALVGDLYDTAHPDRMARAKSIFEGVLGRSLQAGEHPKLQVTVILVGNPKLDTLDVDTYLLSRNDDNAIRDLFSDDKYSFNPERLNASSVEPLTDAVVRARVEKAASEFVASMGMVDGRSPSGQACLKTFPIAYGPAYISCVRTKELAELVLTLQGTPAVQPIQSRHTDWAPGGQAAILAPEKQLKALVQQAHDKAQSMPVLQVWVHDEDHPERPTIHFQNTTTKERRPVSIPVDEMISQDKCIPIKKAFGDICYVWVPLRLEALVGTEKESQKTP
jgi:hypothetical protein